MVGTHAIYLGQKIVGQVTVEKIGLYYHFDCHCQLQSKVMCRVVVSCAGEQQSLGILVPIGSEYILTKQIPAKKFPSDKPEFRISPKQPEMHEICVDVYPEEPFRYIAKLERAYLDKRNGVPKIRIAGEYS